MGVVSGEGQAWSQFLLVLQAARDRIQSDRQIGAQAGSLQSDLAVLGGYLL
jgi:hypothetical protein